MDTSGGPRLGSFCLYALRPKSTAMVMAGRSVHLTTLFLGKLEQAVNQYFVHILLLVTDGVQGVCLNSPFSPWFLYARFEKWDG